MARTAKSEAVTPEAPEAVDPASGDHSEPLPQSPDGESGPGVAEPEVLVLFQMGGTGPGSSLDRQVVQDIIMQLGGLGATREAGSRLDVWLDSPGGDAHAAYKLGLFLRTRFDHVNFVILDYAKSAATLLTFAADDIYMAPAAELGPLDTQENREGEIRLRSLLDTADSVDQIFQQAVINVVSMGGLMLNRTGITREKTMEHLLQFAGAFTRPLLEQIDPITVNAANTALEVATEYGARLLAYRKGRDALAAARRQTEQLVRGYPTHGYVIDRDEARDVLDLPVHYVEEYDHLAEIEALYSQIQRSGMNLVRLFPMSAFKGLIHEVSGEGGEFDDEKQPADGE